jgi:hypothetical protein
VGEVQEIRVGTAQVTLVAFPESRVMLFAEYVPLTIAKKPFVMDMCIAFFFQRCI